MFINREFADFDFLKTYKDLEELIKLYKRELQPQGKVYIFIDEIQLIDGWEKVINLKSSRSVIRNIWESPGRNAVAKAISLI